MTVQERAKKGGQFGVNGDWYEGGKFLPSTDKPKENKISRRAGKKVEIAPYQWEVPPSPDHISILSQVGLGVFTKLVSKYGEQPRIEVVHYTVWVGSQVFQEIDKNVLDRLVAKFNAGERWLVF